MYTRSFRAGLLCSLLVLAGGAILIAEEPPAKVPEVQVARPVVRQVTDYEDFTGRTEAATRVDLRARVIGYLLTTAFQEGAEVKKGDVLFEIDPRPYQAELEKAQAGLLVAEARFKLADADHKRMTALLARKAVSQDEVDKTVAGRVEAEAGVRLARASLDAARLNLDFTRVHAPIDGRVGRRLLDPGNLVKADDTILATLVTREPIYVYFDADERTVLHLRRSLREGERKSEKHPVRVGLADEKGFSHRGVVDFTDIRINPNTGTLRMRAVLPNKEGLLMPGLFVRVRLTIGEPYKALLVPEQALMIGEGAKFVFVVTDKDVVEVRPVELGREHDGLRVVTRGLKPEDRIVIGRRQGLRSGMTVRPLQGEVPVPKSETPPDSGRQSQASPVRGQAGPGLLVEAVYPGANARTVADTVAAPIEQQVNGVNKLLSLRSRCTNDGKYTLAVTFARGTDLDMHQVLVQNRVALAMPVLPEAVQSAGIKIKQEAAGELMFVNLFSPDGRYDSLYLSRYATIYLKDELVRVPGVGAVTLLGASDYGLHIWLDPGKLAACSLNAGQVVLVLEKQKDAGDNDAEKLPDLILKADGEGRLVRLKDVARIELGANRRQSQASFNGKRVVALVIHPTGQVAPRKMSNALRDKLSELRSSFPKGLNVDFTFDFTANLEAPNRPTVPEYLLLDLDLPFATSAERTLKILDQCETLLGQLHGVQDTLALSDNPFDQFGGGPCILVRLVSAEKRTTGREVIIRAIRTRLGEIDEGTVRLRDLSGPGRLPRCSYPLDLAISGPEAEQVRELARNLAERLRGSKKLTDVWVSPDSIPRPQRTVDIDRAAAAARGVAMEDILSTLQVYAGPVRVNDFNRFGRTWRVEIQAEPGSGSWPTDAGKLKIRNARGQMIPLGMLIKVVETEGPLALDFLDLRPMVEITANPEAGVSPAQARTLCETLVEEARKELRLPGEYRLTWLP